MKRKRPGQIKTFRKRLEKVAHRQSGKFCRLRNDKGQGLVEYLLLVSLIAVATMGVVRALSYTVTAKFATVGAQIAGEKKSYKGEGNFNQYVRKKDMANFFEQAASDAKD